MTALHTRFDSPALSTLCVDAAASAPLEVALAARTYVIESGVLSWPERLAGSPNLMAPLAVVVTNRTVRSLHGAAFEAALERSYRRVEVREVPDGESSKHWNCVSWLCEELATMGAGRDVLLVAFGGGVVGDLTGFVAAIYMRGVRFLQVPTTLLAQVDSSVGGKTGINLPQGKNLVGAFHQPEAVWADSTVLGTLPAREYAAGLAEVIKYGPIADLAFFEWLEANMPRLVARDPQAIGVAVRRSCEIKAAIVAMDEREDGIRAVLNFGHTFGHGLERGLGYGALLHGEAVGIGMLMATRLSVAHLGLDTSYLDRLERLLAAAGLPTEVQGWSPQQLLAWMRTDKKAVAGAIRYVVIPKWGEAALASVADEPVRQVLDDTVRAMRG